MQSETPSIEQEVLEYANLPYSITIEPDEADGKLCYVAYHPELPGCMAQGSTPAEAVISLVEAREMCIAGLLRHKLAVPEPKFKITANAA